MLQRLIAAVLGVLGLATIGLGVASATVWRGDDTLVVTTPRTTSGTLVVSAPGVLELGGGPVTVTARATGGTKVVLAIGKDADVAAWVGTDPHALLTGLTNRTTLATRAVPSASSPSAAADATAAAEPAAVPAPDPDGSDMWVQQATGESTARMVWKPVAGRWALLVAGVGDGAAAPVVVLSWSQVVTTPWLVPGIVVGVLLLVVAGALGLREWLRARRRIEPVWHPLETGTIPVVVAAGSSGNDRAPAVAGAIGGAIGGGATVGLAPGLVDGAAGTASGPDLAPIVVMTRRQLREAAATTPTPRIVLRPLLRKPAEHGPGDHRHRMSGGGPAPEAATGTVPDSVRDSGLDSAPAPAPAPSDAGAASSAGVPTEPVAFVGARADAWRRAWGFPEEAATAESSDAAAGTAPDAQTGPAADAPDPAGAVPATERPSRRSLRARRDQ